jgi:site-specific DNA recombinase
LVGWLLLQLMPQAELVRYYFLFEKQNPAEKRRLLDFVWSNSTWKDQTLNATFRQPFDILAVTNTAWQREKAAGVTSSDLRHIWLRR